MKPKIEHITLQSNGLPSTQELLDIAGKMTGDYLLLNLKPTIVEMGDNALPRLIRVAEETDAAMVYSDYLAVKEGETERHPVIDYQEGSLRDDFDFGQVVLIRTKWLKKWGEEVAADENRHYQFAAWYDFRLFLSRCGLLFHLNETLYTIVEEDTRKSGEKQFDYVNPRNREVQIEMERACTEHLRLLNALIDTTSYGDIDFNERDFEVEASVVIPVFNRAKTVADAVKSALSQETKFAFNVIVVDNHSTDGTAEILAELARENGKLIVLNPSRRDLGFGGFQNADFLFQRTFANVQFFAAFCQFLQNLQFRLGKAFFPRRRFVFNLHSRLLRDFGQRHIVFDRFRILRLQCRHRQNGRTVRIPRRRKRAPQHAYPNGQSQDAKENHQRQQTESFGFSFLRSGILRLFHRRFL